MTLPQLQTKLVSAISSQLVNPQVSVGVETAHVSDISVLGAVKEPGKLPMKQGWHVLDALAASGGLTVDKPEYVSATLVRSGSQMIPIDVAQLLDGSPEKSSEMNLALVPGDVLLVEAKDPSITEVQVLGDVAHPGYWPASPTGSVSAVLSEAGGSNLDAALSNATLIHDGTSTNVDLSQILVNGTVASNVSLQPGDTLVIPQNKRWFAVYGAVQKPGYTPYPDGQNLNVFTALSLAGGQTQDADLSKASLVTVVNGQASKITHLDLQALIQRGDSTQNVSIPSDSILYIPNKNDKSHFKAEDLYPITALLNVIHL
jgi:protein involved in polysaccharide export with SLBB domain